MPFGSRDEESKENLPARDKAPKTRNESSFEARTEEKVAEIVAQWHEYVHPRAREFFGRQEELHEVLKQIARGIDKHDDPILGDDRKCVFWYSDVTKDDVQAAIRMIKPGESAESV